LRVTGKAGAGVGLGVGAAVGAGVALATVALEAVGARDVEAPVEQAARRSAKAARKAIAARVGAGRRVGLGDGDTSGTSERMERSEGSR
jgi:hypothetical protein